MFDYISVSIACLAFCFVCLFQAEDGIRDLVRSRGLGDVYKRQGHPRPEHPVCAGAADRGRALARYDPGRGQRHTLPVSYTHLTLPTSDLV